MWKGAAGGRVIGRYASFAIADSARYLDGEARTFTLVSRTSSCSLTGEYAKLGRACDRITENVEVATNLKYCH